MKKLLLPLAGCLALSTGTSSAQILITFTESNGDVEVNINGTIDLIAAAFIYDGYVVASTSAYINDNGLFNYDNNNFEMMAGMDLLTGALVSIGIYSSSVPGPNNFYIFDEYFAIFGPTLIYDNQHDGVTSYTTVGEWVFENQTFSSMGLDVHTANTIIDLWGATATASDSEKVQFIVSTIPEPTSTALLGLGGLGFILRRRR